MLRGTKLVNDDTLSAYQNFSDDYKDEIERDARRLLQMSDKELIKKYK